MILSSGLPQAKQKWITIKFGGVNTKMEKPTETSKQMTKSIESLEKAVKEKVFIQKNASATE